MKNWIKAIFTVVGLLLFVAGICTMDFWIPWLQKAALPYENIAALIASGIAVLCGIALIIGAVFSLKEYYDERDANKSPLQQEKEAIKETARGYLKHKINN